MFSGYLFAPLLDEPLLIQYALSFIITMDKNKLIL
jgi:hypothetical protein